MAYQLTQIDMLRIFGQSYATVFATVGLKITGFGKVMYHLAKMIDRNLIVVRYFTKGYEAIRVC
jgi:hypothetical protein